LAYNKIKFYANGHFRLGVENYCSNRKVGEIWISNLSWIDVTEYKRDDATCEKQIRCCGVVCMC